jgi:hypothetical protein
MSAEIEETNATSTCRSKAVKAATATPKAVGQRCSSTTDQRHWLGGCCARGEGPLAVAWPPTPPAEFSSVMACPPILGHGPTSTDLVACPGRRRAQYYTPVRYIKTKRPWRRSGAGDAYSEERGVQWGGADGVRRVIRPQERTVADALEPDRALTIHDL